MFPAACYPKGGNVFSPASIATLGAWWDASVIGTLFQDTGLATPVTTNGNPIGGWRDISGSGKTLTQGTAAAQPTYSTGSAPSGLPTASFDGGDVMTSAGIGAAQPYTIFHVGKMTTDQTYYYDGALTNRCACGNSLGGTSKLDLFAGSVVGGPATGADSTFHLYAATFNNASSALRLDRAAYSSGTAGTQSLADGFTLGNRYTLAFNLIGNIAEVIIYTSALSAANIVLVENYLKAKWGTP